MQAAAEGSPRALNFNLYFGISIAKFRCKRNCCPRNYYYFFFSRFNLSYEEEREQHEGSGSDADEGGSRLCFSSIEKSAGFLDKELAASGFTRNDQKNIQKVPCFSIISLLLFFLFD